MQVNVRKNDQVKILSGKDRGKVGKVLRILPAKGKAIVEGINFRKKHTKANPAKGVQAGIIQQETPIQISVLMIVCPECGKQTRIKHKKLEDGSKQRICAKCAGSLDK
ncbi:MAG: 50S ribosomal protein L24 [Acidobacteria bacterium]|nr:MAG: 50S ribosomal protein L24 [Acidobacteriota bacterium]